MSTFIRCLQLFLLAGFAVCWSGNVAGHTLAELLAEFDESTPGVLIGVVRDGELVETAAAGMADLRFGVPLTDGSRANIGSTAKQFTGMALAMLHVRGELSLDDDIRQYIPELPEFEYPVTLLHLLNHTSGYREFINAEALAGVRVDKGDWMDVDVIIATVQRQTALQNKPGGEWNYNNTGYGLLAEVVTRVTATPFQDWVRREIFAPLAMNDTHFRPNVDEVLVGASTGYTKSNGRYLESRDIGGALGAGGVYTTLADMARWMAHLGRFELGGDPVRELMVTPFGGQGGQVTGYGLGIVVDRFRGQKRWQHGGGDVGHLSVFDYYPEHDAGYMIFANHHGIDEGFISAVAELVLGQHLEPVAASEDDQDRPDQHVALTEFSDELFDRYLGRFELEAVPGFIMRFFRDNDRYMIQASGQPAFEIKPVGPNEFTQDQVGARFVFHVDEDGNVQELTLHQGGEHRALRVDEDHEAPDFSIYAGRYLSHELETIYTIVVGKAGELELRHRRFDPIVLKHSGADSFNGDFPVVSVDFLRNEAGEITALKAGNVRARDIVFERIQ
ncbi:MAG: serine hydrolase [Wenzhouxiangella sp.]|nr:serine hydrolase [Wenzhouxiangella sp.]